MERPRIPFKITITEEYNPFQEGGVDIPKIWILVEAEYGHKAFWERFIITEDMAVSYEQVIPRLKSTILKNIQRYIDDKEN